MKRLTQGQRALIQDHLRVAREMVTQVPTRLPYGERYSAAYWGLVQASTKWAKTGTFESYARRYIYGSIIRDSMRANYARLGGKRQGVSSRVHLDDWDWHTSDDPGFEWIDDADELSCWRNELARRLPSLTPTEAQAIQMRQAGLVGDRALRQHGVSMGTNSDRLRKAIERLRQLEQ